MTFESDLQTNSKSWSRSLVIVDIICLYTTSVTSLVGTEQIVKDDICIPPLLAYLSLRGRHSFMLIYIENQLVN